MSRLESGPRVTVKPSPNIYSVMAIIAALAVGAALAFTIIQWNALVR
jgi:hypothetical protein